MKTEYITIEELINITGITAYQLAQLRQHYNWPRPIKYCKKYVFNKIIIYQIKQILLSQKLGQKIADIIPKPPPKPLKKPITILPEQIFIPPPKPKTIKQPTTPYKTEQAKELHKKLTELILKQSKNINQIIETYLPLIPPIDRQTIKEFIKINK
jgi:hypothetical protein